MAIDLKYGRVTTEHGSIGEDEPVIVFRAKDETVPKLLAVYYQLCLKAGSPERHLEIIEQNQDRFAAWQTANDTKVPDSEASRAWMS